MGKSQRSKGARGERELADLLRSLGHANAARGNQFGGARHKTPDVVGLPGVHIECKREQGVGWLRPLQALQQARNDAQLGEVSAVAFRVDHGEWCWVIPIEDTDRFIDAWIKSQANTEQA
jgi:Holliday junction resolvase